MRTEFLVANALAKMRDSPMESLRWQAESAENVCVVSVFRRAVSSVRICCSKRHLEFVGGVLLFAIAVLGGCSTSSNHGTAAATTTVGVDLRCPTATSGIGINIPSGAQGGSTPAEALAVFLPKAAATGVELPGDVVGSVVQSGDKTVGVYRSNGKVVAQVDMKETSAGWFVTGVAACA